MNESIFGELALWEKRASQVSEQRKGLRHNWQLEPTTPSAVDTPTVRVEAEVDASIDRLVCIVEEPEFVEIPLELTDTQWDTLNWEYSQTWKGTLPTQKEGTIVRYRFEAHANSRKSPIAVEDGQVFTYLVGDPAPPDWSREAIVYQIFPDRFSPGGGRVWNPVSHPHDIYGGTLRGVQEKLGYITDLGFNCLWLNPIFPDSTHHGYQASDYFSLNPRLGSMQDLEDFVAACDASGVRLILDLAANHWGRDHATFQDAQKHRNSEYHDWYFWNEWPHGYKSYFGIRDMPKLNVDHPGVRNHLKEAVEFWLGEIGFSGLRLDHAQGVSLDFWTDFRRVVKSIKPDAWMFGEVTDTPVRQMTFAGRLDGCLDFLLAQALRDTFAFGSRSPAELDAFLTKHNQFFPNSFSRPSFLDNHDMDRFLHISQLDSRRLKLAALCQFTQPAPPIVYYGTEVGVLQEFSCKSPEGRGLAESRQKMLWDEDQDKDLHQFYRDLIHLRRDHPVITRGTRQTEHLDSATKTYVYVVVDSHEKLQVGMNLSDQTQEISLPDHTFNLPPLSGDVHIEPVV